MGNYYLDGALYYLGRNLSDLGAIDLLMIRSEQIKAVLVFRNEELAKEHLAKLPKEFELHRLKPGDMRAKEEFLRAAIKQGALELYLDADANLQAAAHHSTTEALSYVLSFKREIACI